METFASRFIEVDLHCLDLRFAHLRLGRAKALEALVRSIERDGQRTPVVAVLEADHRWVLIDGYLRVAALRRCGQDTVRVGVWPCDLPQALIAILAQAQQRPWQSIEEAHLIQELHAAFGYSQHDIARQIGRDVSWVNRRLALIAALPDDLLEAVYQEQVSSWAASRIRRIMWSSTLMDELGYLPIDKAGADLLFQVISLRYEQGAMIMTSNRVYKEWPKIFNNDSTLTAAILDRLLHHAETVIIEGKSYRMKGRLEP